MDEAQVGRLLLAESDNLAQRVVALVWERVPGYEPPRLRRDDLADAVRPNVESVLAHVIAPSDARDEDEARARELGTARALQGVPLDVVIQSFRAAERVLDDAFAARSTELTTDQLRSGLHRLSEGFDRLSGWVIEAYRQTQDELTSHYDRAAGDLVAGLVAGDLDETTVLRQGTSLGLDPEAAYTGVAVQTASEAGLGRTPARLEREVLGALAVGRSGRLLSGAARGATIFVVPGEPTPRSLRDLSRLVATYRAISPRVGVGPVSIGLLDAGRSCRRAVSTVALLSAPGLATYDDVLLDAVVVEADDVARRLRDRLGGALASASHLRETISAFFAADMSIRDAAEDLRVHPNTVAYRLDRIWEVTGLNPRRTADLVTLDLAVRALALAASRDVTNG